MPATTVVLFGATGDLAKRKLLPGMLHLHESQLLEGLRLVATSLGPDARRVPRSRDRRCAEVLEA